MAHKLVRGDDGSLRLERFEREQIPAYLMPGYVPQQAWQPGPLERIVRRVLVALYFVFMALILSPFLLSMLYFFLHGRFP